MISLKQWMVPTMSHLPRNIVPFLLPFSILFHLKKSFIKMILLFVGGTICHGGRTVCGCLRVLGMKGESAFANYHQLLNRSRINMLEGVRILIKMLLPLTGSTVIFVVDEHLERRRGDKIKAKATYRDPVASSKKRLVKCTGLKWVVLTILVRFPWTSRFFALPVFCALRYPENHPKNLGRTLRSGTDLICQMLIVIRRWFPYLSITLLGDGDYARVKLCNICKKLSIDLVSRMRADARLHDFVPEGKRKGRRPKVGRRLGRPEESLWEKISVQWYGGRLKDVTVSTRNCLWLAGKESAVIILKAVWVQLRPKDEIILMSTALNLNAMAVIEGYVKRWNIEVTFRECRDYLGVETQRQWSDLAIARTTPLLFALYTLITLIGNAIYQEKGIIKNSTAWYKKTCLTFSDLHEAVRNEIGDVTNIVNSVIFPELGNMSGQEGIQSRLQQLMGL
jgi:hypothetical protein